MDSEERKAREQARFDRARALGHRIRVLRADRGHSHAELSERAGLSRQYLSELENGKRPRPRTETLEKLAAALGVTVDTLLGKAPGPVELLVVPPDAAPPPPPAGAASEARRPPRHAMTPEELHFLIAHFVAELPLDVTVTHRTYPDGYAVIHLRLPGARNRAHT